jgi:hypothetical protein
MSASDLEQVIGHYHEALGGIVRGDADPMKPLSPERDEMTLANPLAPPTRGRSQRARARAAAASGGALAALVYGRRS